jgi:ribosomal protein S20
MPNTSSAKKALRVSEKKEVFNKLHKNKIKQALKEFRRSLASTIEDSRAALAKAFSELDRAAKTKTIKKGNADRKKSRLSANLKKTFEQVEGGVKNVSATATKVKSPSVKKAAKPVAKKTSTKSDKPVAKKTTKPAAKK